MILESQSTKYEILDVRSPLLDLKEVTKSTVDLLACRRKFHWRINERLEPKRKAKVLEIGDLWHAVMASHYLAIARKQGKLKYKPEREYGSVDEEIQAFVSSTQMEPDEAVEVVEMIRAGYDNFLEKFHDDEDRYAVLGVEYRVKVPVPGMESWSLSAGIDLLLGEYSTRNIIIVDHKTTTKQREDHIPKADLAFQGWDYASVMSKILGKRVEHICFQGMRKKVPAWPEPLKSTNMPSTERIPDTTALVFEAGLRAAKNALMKMNPDDKSAGKSVKAGLAVKMSDYSSIISNLHGREDPEGNSFIWRKFGIVDGDRQNMFWNDLRSKILDIEQERRWSTAWELCESHGHVCQYKNLCAYGDSPEMRAAFNVRDDGNLNPSVKSQV